MQTADQVSQAQLTPEQLAARQALINSPNTAAPIAAPAATTHAAAPIDAAPTPTAVQPKSAMQPTNIPPEDHFLSDLQKKRIQDYEAKKWNPDDHGTLGKIGHGLLKAANIAGDIVAPGLTALIPGSDLNKKFGEERAEKGYETAKAAEDKTALEKAQALKAGQGFAFHYQDESGNEIGVRPNGTTEQLPQGSVTPQRERQNSVNAYLKTPDDPAARKKVEADPGTWQKNIPFNGTISPDGKLVADPNAPQILIDRNLVTGTATPVGTPKQSANAGKPTLKMVPTGDGMEQLTALDPMHPEDMSKAHKIGAPEPLGTSSIMFNDKGEATGTFNNKTQKVSPYSPDQAKANAAAGSTPQEQRVQQQKKSQFNSQYEKPATDIEQNFQKFQEAYQEYQHDPKTGAASMVALAQHLGSTFGSVKGAQMGENMIAEHKDAIGYLDKIARYANQVATGQQLDSNQWKEFNDLITKTREIQWDTTAREAFRQGLPVNMVPKDIKVGILSPTSGKTLMVPGNRLEEAIKDGGKIE